MTALPAGVARYRDFLATKRRVHHDAGRPCHADDVHPSLFGFQRDLVAWAVRKGRAAILADTGLGKTRMQLEWARLSGEPTLILAPLAVAQQTIAEAAAIDLDVRYVRHQGEVDGIISISNYERLDRFDPAAFGAVVLDESSILKAFSGTTKKALIKAFAGTPWRLCCTATPAPNDLEELCNHADFLGVMKPSEMRSTFFIADNRGQFMKYRIKRHARGPFFRWLSSWAMAVRRPSDIGYSDDGYDLPPLEILAHFVTADYQPEDRLFVTDLRGVGEQARVRRATTPARVAEVAALAAAEADRQWLIWCGLNDEARLVTKVVEGAVNVEGSQSADDKADALGRFARGEIRCLVSKPSLAGFGMNFQRCARLAFCGLGYSYEQYYQAIRRCWRYGQHSPVQAHLVLADVERPILALVKEKERQAAELASGLVKGMAVYEQAELLRGTSAGDDYEPRAAVRLPAWIGGS